MKEKNRFELELEMDYKKLKSDSENDIIEANVLDTKLKTAAESLPKEKEAEIHDVVKNLPEDDSSEVTPEMIGNLSDFFE